MKDFRVLSFWPWGIINLLIAVPISATNGNMHSASIPQDHVQLVRRQDQSSSSGTPALFEDASKYPSFPSKDTSPDSTSTKSSIEFTVSGQTLAQDVECKTCSAQGDISIQEASDSSSDKDSSKWSLLASTTGISAHVELGAKLRPAADLLSFEVSVNEIELDAIEVGGLVVVAPKIVVEVVGIANVSADVDFSGGFDFTVPDEASISITINGTDLDASIQGFNGTKITQLPFSANISNPEISMFLGLRFNLLLAVSPLSSLLPSVYAGIYINLPDVIISSSLVSNRNANCEEITSDETDAALRVPFPNLLFVNSTAFADIGGTIGYDIPGKGFDFKDAELDGEVEFALPSQCLEWSTSSEGGGRFGKPDTEALTKGKADTDLATASTTGAAQGSSPTSGSSSQRSSNAAGNVLIVWNDMSIAYIAMLTLVLAAFGAAL
ncbi:hypothetical protein ONS95_004566 [Cadophora gregata]|uniref:uncharacterized protein n=1 Tax=Cadophora gregata TaxID=51156 RepID=UPI0026DD828F|nr:uncharacterized protein ONS95_004566 [Cadophora gregata]KAK0105070.1 hypothetical protein ONS96_004473 [Cadophora gregata f. sp. sojae]KAK0106061.1 hypothetical protein ONS95_004566 [Cadophora gregata]